MYVCIWWVIAPWYIWGIYSAFWRDLICCLLKINDNKGSLWDYCLVNYNLNWQELQLLKVHSITCGSSVSCVEVYEAKQWQSGGWLWASRRSGILSYIKWVNVLPTPVMETSKRPAAILAVFIFTAVSKVRGGTWNTQHNSSKRYFQPSWWCNIGNIYKIRNNVHSTCLHNRDWRVSATQHELFISKNTSSALIRPPKSSEIIHVVG